MLVVSFLVLVVGCCWCKFVVMGWGDGGVQVTGAGVWVLVLLMLVLEVGC